MLSLHPGAPMPSWGTWECRMQGAPFFFESPMQLCGLGGLCMWGAFLAGGTEGQGCECTRETAERAPRPGSSRGVGVHAPGCLLGAFPPLGATWSPTLPQSAGVWGLGSSSLDGGRWCTCLWGLGSSSPDGGRRCTCLWSSGAQDASSHRGAHHSLPHLTPACSLSSAGLRGCTLSSRGAGPRLLPQLPVASHPANSSADQGGHDPQGPFHQMPLSPPGARAGPWRESPAEVRTRRGLGQSWARRPADGLAGGGEFLVWSGSSQRG